MNADGPSPGGSFGHDDETSPLGPRPGEAFTDEPRPTRIGPYVIREVVGEGGFGIVYAAEQVEPVRRRVALKVIKPGMDSRAVIARFEAERQALAVMDHPGVAKVFDGGRVPPGQPGAGRPYFVMEYVSGEPIGAFCDRHRLTIDERIRLMIRVCEAVQHAHTKAVIHRDIKPSNILVGYVDGVPSAKVIDFGVAKSLHPRGGGAPGMTELFTERGQMIGTPEYMSPEQAEMSGVDIDTRSDVYSLGVVFYELLTGVRPFDLRESGLVEIQRTLREAPVAKPSTRVRRLAQGEEVPASTDAGRIAFARRASLRHISRELRGDLDAIVSVCLAKDRAERYASASELAADLRRSLAGEPISARPVGGVRAALRYARRHERAVSLLVLMVALSLMMIAQVIVAGISFEVLGSDPAFDAWLESNDSPALPPGVVHATLIVLATIGVFAPYAIVGLGSLLLAALARSWRARTILIISSALVLVVPLIEMLLVVEWMHRVEERQQQAAQATPTDDVPTPDPATPAP